MGLGPAFPIVISGGINAGSPFTVGDIALITGNSPPTVGNSIMSQQVDGAVTYVAVSQATIGAGLTETFRTAGGIVSEGAGGVNSAILGAGAAAAGANSVSLGSGANDAFGGVPQAAVAIGRLATTGGSGIAIGLSSTAKVTAGTDTTIAIGDGATAEANSIALGAVTAGKNTIAIGGAATDTGTGNTVLIGLSASTSSNQAVGIGHTVRVQANQSVAVGQQAQVSATGGVAVGRLAIVNSTHTDSIAVGHGAQTTAANQAVIGGSADSATGISSVVIGNGPSSATPIAVTVQGTNATGVDIAGVNFTIQPGLGTGAGTPGQFVVQVAPALASGVTQQVAVPILSVSTGTVYVGGTVANINLAGYGNTLRIKGSVGVGAEAAVPIFQFARVDGTFAAPTQIQSGDLLGSVGFAGYNTAAPGLQNAATWSTVAAETWSATGRGTLCRFSTTKSGTLVSNTVLQLENDQSVAFGTFAGSYGGGSRVIFIANAATNPTTNPTGGGILYVSAGALVWRGSSGTVTTLAPA